MNRISFFLISLFLVSCLSGQTIEDALRYSQLSPTGTARFAGTAGALTPLGVDFTTLSTNPAGIGWVRRGYFVITPGIQSGNATSQLFEGTDSGPQDASKGRFTLPNIGAVFSTETRSLYFPTFNIAVGFNRLADFNETINYSGNSPGSLIQSFVEDANDGLFSDFRNELAFEVDAILEDDQGFFSDFLGNPDGIIRREGTVARTGGMSEFVLGFGGNYRDKVMWGATLGVPFMNFKEVKEYNEIDSGNEIEFFDDLGYDETLETSGNGINFKFGLIYRASQAVRVSAAVHTPTFWSIDETYETTFSYAYTDADNVAQGGTALSPISEFAYNLQTPWRFLLGVGSIISDKAFISADFDYVNYQGNKFSYDDFATEAEAVNEDIDNSLTSGISMRVGGEINLSPIQLRLGGGIQTFPLKDADQTDLLLSGGIGYRKGKFFMDVAYQYLGRNRIFQPYSTFRLDPQQFDVDYVRHNFLLSAGVLF